MLTPNPKDRNVNLSWRAAARNLSALAVAALASAALITASPPAYAQFATEIIGAETSWRYFDEGTDPAAERGSPQAWADTDFDDSTWKQGTGPFGANRGEQTELSGGYLPKTLLRQYYSDTTTNKPSYFFRTTVSLSEQQLAAAQAGSGVRVKVRYDDAVAIFVNGRMASEARFDWTDGAGNMDFFGSNGSAPKEGVALLSASMFTVGDNVIGMQLHQGRPTSSDIYLDMTELAIVTGETGGDIDHGQYFLSQHIGAIDSDRRFSWATKQNTPVQRLQVAIKGDGGEFDGTLVTDVQATESSYRDTSGTYRFYRADVSGLAPHTTYLYRIGSDGHFSAPLEFSTRSFDTTGELKVTMLGDPQIGASDNVPNDEQGWVTTLSRAVADLPDADFLLSVGDQVDNYAGDLGEYKAFFTPDQLRSAALVSTIGNHDVSPMFEGMFNRPNIDFDYGSREGQASGNYHFISRGVLFVVLNSNDTNLGGHGEYLAKMMKEYGGKTRWQIVVQHHNTYSSASHALDTSAINRQRELTPVISRLGYDAVLSGHDHIYSRSYLVDANNKVAETDKTVQRPRSGQVLYLTANSASGSKFYAEKTSDAVQKWISVSKQTWTPNWTNLVIDDEKLEMRTFAQALTPGSHKELVDSVVLYRQNIPALTVPADSQIDYGTAFDSRAGVVATTIDGLDISGKVQIAGTVDTHTAGAYHLTYTVSAPADGSDPETAGPDTDMVTASAHRTVTVREGSPTKTPEVSTLPVVSSTPLAPSSPVAPSTTQTPSTAQVLLSGQHVAAGGELTLQLRGFAPNETVRIELHSTPVLLGEVRTDSAGLATAQVRIPAETAVGVHRIVASGAAHTAVAEITIGAVTATSKLPGTVQPAAAKPLATTGFSAAQMATLAVALLVAGATVAGINRRRKAHRS